MNIACIVLALSVSIDSLGIGVTYGLKNTKIQFLSKVILFIISLFITLISIFFGAFLSHFLPDSISDLLGCCILFFMGLWIIYTSICNKKINDNAVIFKKIIGNPICSDIDNSKNIDPKESIFLGLALSLDSISVGFGSGIIGISSLLFSLLVPAFQFIFISFGIFLGKTLVSKSKIPENVWNTLSGILLIFIGFIRLFF